MHDALHLVAVGLTATAACVHPGWTRRASSSDLVAAILMLAAMVDVAYVGAVTAPLWSTALLIAAIGLAAMTSPRSRRQRRHAAACAVPHSALGLVATAALLPLMHGVVPAAASHAGHGVGSGALVAAVLAVACGHVALCVVASARERQVRARVQHVLMGATTVLMAAAVAA